MPGIIVVLDVIEKILVTGGLFFIAGVFNGNADQIVFDHKDNPRDDSIWSKILKGEVLKWFNGEYKDFISERWWGHAILYDGWHFFKNAQVLTYLLMAIYLLPDMAFVVQVVVFIVFARIFQIAKTSMHGKIASAKYWGK